MYKNKLEQMTHVEAGAALKKCKVAVLPIGSYEQHGPYLPVCTDSIIAAGIVDEIAKKFKGDDILFLPPQIYGYCDYHTDFPGTLSLRESTLRTVLLELLDCITRWGVKRILIINSHGGNAAVLKGVGQELRTRGITCAFSQWWEVAVNLNKDWGGRGHADTTEISAVYKWRPEWIVRPAEGFKEPVHNTVTDKIRMDKDIITEFEGVPISVVLRTKDKSETGALLEEHLGGSYFDMNEAKEGRIDECIDKVTDFYLRFLEEFKKVEYKPVTFPARAYNYDNYE